MIILSDCVRPFIWCWNTQLLYIVPIQSSDVRLFGLLKYFSNRSRDNFLLGRWDNMTSTKMYWRKAFSCKHMLI